MWYIETLDLIFYDLKQSRLNVPFDVYVTWRRCVPTTGSATGATFLGQAVHPKRDSKLKDETDRLFRNVGN
jgi:hypothetical protein